MNDLTRYPPDQGIQPGWEDAEFYLCSEVDKLLARRAPDPLLGLVRELRDALEQAGRSLDNADIPWPWDKSLFVRADAVLAEAAEVERLMVLATRYNDERITAELEVERLRERADRAERDRAVLESANREHHVRIEALEGCVRELRQRLWEARARLDVDNLTLQTFERQINATLTRADAALAEAPKAEEESRE
jgi:hypothetical protein